MLKKRFAALLLLGTAIFTITVSSGFTVYANTNDNSGDVTVNGKKDIPDIFSLPPAPPIPPIK